MPRMTVVATEMLEELDMRRLERAGYTPVVRWQRATEDGALVLTTTEAIVEIAIQERRAVRRRLRGVS